MTLRHLRIFVTVCKSSNTTTAAETLFMSQPAISLAIKELEDYYGIKLFDRISKRLCITSMGENFLQYASHIVSLFDDMEFSIRNWDALGRLRIGSSITIGTQLLPEYVNEFSRQWPEVQLKVAIDSTDTIVKRLLNNDFDLALIEGTTNSPNLIVDEYMSDELTVICSPQHPFATRGVVTLNELRTEKFLLREFGSGTRDLFDHVMKSKGIHIEPSWESTSTTALVNAAVKNLGIAVIPLRLAQAIPAEGEICLLKIENVRFQRKFSIIYHKNKFLTPSALSFMKICKQEMEDKVPSSMS